MPHTQTSVPGSGTVWSMKDYLPGGINYGVQGRPQLTYRDAEAVAIVNPEDFSAWMGPGSTHQITLAPSTATRLDNGVANRRSVAIANASTTETIYVGFNDSITITGATGGFPVFPLTTITINCTNRYHIYAIASSTITVGIMEVV